MITHITVGVCFRLYFSTYKEAISDDTDDEFNDFNKKHGAQSKPDTKNAADAGPQFLAVHHRPVFDDGRIHLFQQYVQLKKILADHCPFRRVLQCKRPRLRLKLESLKNGG